MLISMSYFEHIFKQGQIKNDPTLSNKLKISILRAVAPCCYRFIASGDCNRRITLTSIKKLFPALQCKRFFCNYVLSLRCFMQFVMLCALRRLFIFLVLLFKLTS